MSDPVETPRRGLTAAIVPALAAAALAGLGAMFLVSRQQEGGAASAAPAGCILEGADALGGPFVLVDTNGQRVTQADFAGQPAIVYFGYTHCPDVCPTTLYALAEALALPEGYDAAPIFITADPERDTPAVLGAYVATSGFPEDLVGLTGSSAQVQAAMRAFQASSSRAPADANGQYAVNHSSFMYVLDGQWRTVAAMPTFRPGEISPETQMSPMVPVEPEALQACIVAGLDRTRR